MAKQYNGSLTLDWFNKQRALINSGDETMITGNEVPAPAINWINKDDALFYDIDEGQGKGDRPYWVDRNDIRVKEARPLVFQSAYCAKEMGDNWEVIELNNEVEAGAINNMLIKGDNLLVLNTLKKHFDQQLDGKRVKCIYIDPPYNTGKAFENYDDNIESSTWLTLMRDRLTALRGLLATDGILYIQLDEKFIFYIKVMLDDIFGKENFLNFFTIKTSDPSGFKTVNPSPYDCSEYILMYARNKPEYKYETIFVPSEYDAGYNKYILNINESHEHWQIKGLNQHIAELNGHQNTRDAKKAMGDIVFNSVVAEFAINNADSVFQATAIGNDAGADMVNLRNESKGKPSVICKLERNSGNIEYALNGRQVYFYSNKIKTINGKKTPTKQLTNIWADIPYNGIAGEGDVEFAESKKPEKLIRRLLDIANVGPGDIVLDSFSGSGTTVAVAQKMGASWIGIEIGNHMDTHIIKRMTNVIGGLDESGVTTDLTFKGGGSFKYYHLGKSIISIDGATGKGEFNWPLGKEFIQDSLLISYDFMLQNQLDVLPARLFSDREKKITVGKILGKSGKSIYGVAYLAEPNSGDLTITNEEIKNIYSSVRGTADFHSLVIYTNKGIDIAQDAIPGDMEIIKVPNAVFADLEN